MLVLLLLKIPINKNEDRESDNKVNKKSRIKNWKANKNLKFYGATVQQCSCKYINPKASFQRFASLPEKLIRSKN